MRAIAFLFSFILTSLLFAVPAFAAEQASRDAAVTDAASWSFHDQDVYTLDGPWTFYWRQLLEPRDFADQAANRASAAAPSSATVKLPHIWGTSTGEGSGRGGRQAAPDRQGYATYRLLLQLNDAERDTVKALYVPAAASAYKLWINGELKAQSGEVGTQRETMKPKNYARVIYFQALGGSNEIVIQVSNFVQRKGGLWTSLYVGSPEAITYKREFNLVSQLVISIVLLTLGGYHLALFLLRKLDHLSLLISLVCVLLAIRSMLLGDTLLVRLFPDIPWELAVKAEYLAPYIGIPIFALFVNLLYPQDMLRRLTQWIVAVGFAFALVVLLFPARVFTYTMVSFQVYSVLVFTYLLVVFFRAAYRRREGAMLNGLASIVMFLAVLNDILYYNAVLHSIDFAPYGVVVFIFVQTLIVALKFSNAYYKVEKVSGELLSLNATLEDRIKVRTQELERSYEKLKEANGHLKQAESSRQRLLANISHELGTPMTAVQGYLKAMLDGIIRTDERHYLQMIYDKVVLVSRLVQDLFDLSKLEAGKAKFHFTYVTVEDLFLEYFGRYRLDVENRGLRFELVPPESGESPSVPIVSIDPFRIQQVTGNMIYNALKFTPEGGSVSIRGELAANPGDPAKGELIVSIVDSGVGIEPSVLLHVFDRFVKGSGEQTGRAGEGSGLGLAIAKEIINIHGGKVEADSKLNEGSTFRFTLPVEFLHMEVG
ncbi:cell wall metabolism sensor histidine kinase WalK [Paenibacillus sp. tmac-D7]|uniref:sensor histidine kinase n=1 Tax=Paenibacillus sp. tmac-D7 TaxID=2591462 RepID=UPI001143C936|nr:sensor histidine kinase [Paenibacillus sp. tmac-D7]